MTHALEYAKPKPPSAPSRLLRAIHFAAVGYPLLLFVAFYGAWALAWAMLGHRPRVSLDDPARTLGPFYFVSYLVVLGLPAGVVLGIVSTTLRFISSTRKRQAFVWCAAIAISWLVVMTLLRADPSSVVDWWMD